MATRFYLPSNTETPDSVTPAFGSGWEQTTGATRGTLALARTGKSATARGIAETSVTNNIDVLVSQYISAPMAAQTVTGNWTAVIRALESSTSANDELQMIVRVVSNDGSTERGVVYAGQTVTTVNATVGALGQEFATGTAATRIIPTVAGSSVTASSGDRLVVELGYRANNTSATSFTGTLTVGDDQATDYALTAGTTTTANPWVETDQNLTWLTAKTSTLVDTFDSYDSSKWPYTNGTTSYAGGVLTVTPLVSDTAGINTEVSAFERRYDLTSSQIALEVPQVPTTSDGVALVAGRESTPDNRIFMLQQATSLIFRYNDTGVADDTSVTYSATTHRWWRIRHDGTNVLWETSPNGFTWTTQRSKVPTWDASYLFLSIEVYGNTTVAGTAIFDNFNTTVADVAPVTAAGQNPVPAVAVNAGQAAVACDGFGATTTQASTASPPQADTTVDGLTPAASVAVQPGQADVAVDAFGATAVTVTSTNATPTVAACSVDTFTPNLALAPNADFAPVSAAGFNPALTLTSTVSPPQADVTVDAPTAADSVGAAAGIGDGDTYLDAYVDDYAVFSTSSQAYGAAAVTVAATTATAGQADVTVDASPTTVGRQNLCPNPGCGSNITGWAGGSTPTRATGLGGLPVTTGAHYSANSFAQTPTGTAVAGLAYTGSFYVNNQAGVALNSITLYLAFTRTVGGDDFGHTTTVNLPTGVSRVSLTATAPANTTGVYMVLDTFNASLGSGVDLTGCLLEAAGTIDTYFDGDSPGGSWSGTAENSASALTGAGSSLQVTQPTTQADTAADAYNPSVTTSSQVTVTPAQADVAVDGQGATATPVSVATAGQAAVAVDSFGPALTLTGVGNADVALAAADANSAAPSLTTATGQAAVSADGFNTSVTAASNAPGDVALVDAAAFNPSISTSSSVTANAVEALVDVAVVNASPAVTQQADVAAVACDGFTASAVTVPFVTASAGQADVAADGQGGTPQPAIVVTPTQADTTVDSPGATPAVTVAAGVAAVPVDANGATASTSSNFTANAVEALVAVDAATGNGQISQPADVALVAVDTFNPSAVTFAGTTANAGWADVGVDAQPASAQPSLSIPADFAIVGVDAVTATVTTAAVTTASALDAQATAQAFNALVQVLATAGSAGVGVDALGVPKKRRPGVLTPGTTRTDPTAGTEPYPRLTAGTLRGPTYTGG